MARKSEGEKIDELEKLVATLTERLNELKEEVRDLDLPRLSQRVAVLENQVEELKKSKEEWGRRAWAIVGPIVGAIGGALATYLIRK